MHATIAPDGGSRKLCPHSVLTISNIDLTPTRNLIYALIAGLLLIRVDLSEVWIAVRAISGLN
jgi:hypothetical protein